MNDNSCKFYFMINVLTIRVVLATMFSLLWQSKTQCNIGILSYIVSCATVKS